MAPNPWQAWGGGHAGSRGGGSQDAWLAEAGLGLLAVADGVGGRAAGGLASSLAVQCLRELAQRRCRVGAGETAREFLERAAAQVNQELRRQGARDPSLRGMCTTLTACLLEPGVAHFLHAGDSKAFLLRGQALSQLTQDHTTAQLRQGSGARPAQEPDRLLAALGLNEWPAADLFSTPLSPGDRLLLCTDGVTAVTGPGDLAWLAAQTPVALGGRRLLELVRARGGQDDACLVLGLYPATAGPDNQGDSLEPSG